MLAFITGSGFYDFAGFERAEAHTRFGKAEYLRGHTGDGQEVLLLPRHGAGHRRLSNHINHRANLLALKEAGAGALVACSVMGSAALRLKPGTAVYARDLFFPANRLPCGGTCTLFDEEGAPGRGHLLAESLFHKGLSEAVASLGREHAIQPAVYGHVDGPRFNTQTEVRWLAGAGVEAVSQTCGPEAVLANELELPFALAGFIVDYANGVADQATPVAELQENLAASRTFFERLIRGLPALLPDEPVFENFVYRFE